MKNNIDFYFDKNYGKLYEKIENGKTQIFNIENEYGKISNQFLIREIPEKIDGKMYYDIVTPYGYGGPIIESSTVNKEKLLECYENEFTKYCLENNIVSEFVRFHPIIKNYIDFEKMYNPIYMRKTLITKLDEQDLIQNQFGKSARKNIRQALNKGVTYKIIEKPTDISIFKDIYYSTMDRNNAIDYYYFDDEYFNNVVKYYQNNLILIEVIYEESIIAAGIYFAYNDCIHIHLSGTKSEYLYLSPAYILRYAVCMWGIENGYKLVHHGGGRSNNLDDNLYLFKKNFAKLYDADFYIGKKIWNEIIYNKLCEIKKVDKNEPFFPAYRKN